MESLSYESDLNRIMIEVPPFPERLMLETSSICNHQCVFCGYAKGSRKRQIIPRELALSVIGQAHEAGSNEVCFHSMGEPLLCKDLAEYVTYAKKIGYTNVFIDTNGALADIETVRPIIDAGIDDIKFSINASNPEDYKAIHGRDDFEAVINNVKTTSEYIKKTNSQTKLYVSVCETKRTMGQGEELKKIIGDYIDRLFTVVVTNQAGNMTDEYDELSVGQPELEICTEPFSRIVVTAEGLISACCMDNDNTFVYGDVRENSLVEIWKSDKAKKIRNSHLTGGELNIKCRKCYYQIYAFR